MSHGVPFICFNIPGFSWIPNGVCIKVAPFNTGVLASEICNLLADSDKVALLGKTGQKFAQKFSWEKIAGEYRSYISKILIKHGRIA